MSNWWRKKEEGRAASANPRIDWRASPAHLLLLSRFRHGAASAEIASPDLWESVLNEPIETAIQRLLSESMIEPAPLQSLIEYHFPVSALKEELRQRGLKVSGRKPELASRLAEADPDGMHAAVAGVVLYSCTSESHALVDAYIEKEDTKKHTAMQQSFDHLRRKDLRKAVEVMASFESARVFPRGMGIDWAHFDPGSDVAILKDILGRTPGILRGIKEESLAALRPAAAMTHLWGQTKNREWLADDLTTGIHLDAGTSARMLIFHAYYFRDLRSYTVAGIKTLQILSARDTDCCESCRRLDGKEFEVRNAPELPNPDCTSPMGCRCTTISVF